MIDVKAEKQIEYLRSELLQSKHAFSTRLGGVSCEEHTKGLNLAFGRGDDREVVLENLRLFAEAVGFDAGRLVSVSQIHSADVRVIDECNAGQGYTVAEEFQCDGYVTAVRGLAIGIKTADCVPILAEGYAENGEVCAVGAFHAGWRGTVAGIAAEGVRKLRKLGAIRIRVAIGPSICENCFEVRKDFYDAVAAAAGEAFVRKYVLPDEGKVGVWHADLRAMNKDILLSEGVAECDIDICNECTCCLPSKYFSHRYSHGLRGTHLSVIVF